jgi:hypothetical protein
VPEKLWKRGSAAEPLRLVGLNPVGVDRPGVELHLLGEQVGDDPVGIGLVIRRTLPVILEAVQEDELVGFPLAEDERPAADGPAVEGALAHGETFRVTAGAGRLAAQGVVVQQVLGQDAHGPGADGR